tara:strand:- start:1273 stop:1680 length:408 start_codon:yes stop_codon:yes gene_type:complete
MDDTDKLIIFTFSGATMLIGCLVITFACIFTPRIREEDTPDNSNGTEDITRVARVVTHELGNDNADLNDNQIDVNQDNEKIDNIIQNFRESLTPAIEESNLDDRNNIMLTFTPQHLIAGPGGEIYDPHQVSETDF